MAKPVISAVVELPPDSYSWDNIIKQEEHNTTLNHGTFTCARVTQGFRTADVANQILKGVTVKLDCTAFPLSPVDCMRCAMYKGHPNEGGTYLDVSSVCIGASDIDALKGLGYTLLDDLEFYFPFNLDLDADSDYYLWLDRSGSWNNSQYFKTRYHNNNPYNPNANCRLSYWDANADQWVYQNDWDLWFIADIATEITEVDISNDLLSIKIDRGKNDIGGDFVEGTCELELRNKDGRFNTKRYMSPFWGTLSVGLKFILKATYNSVEYPLFKGYIQRIRPDAEFAERSAYFMVADAFSRFKEKNISIGTQTAKEADELINTILDALGVSGTDRDVELDVSNQNLANVTWDEIKGFSGLETVVEVGQHHHFIGGEGKYYFKNNQWLKNPDIDYTYYSEDIGGLKIEDDIKGIFNRSRVKYPGGWETKDDSDSIAKYGQRDYSMENELMPNAGYAGSIAQHITAFLKESDNGIDIVIEDKFPDVLNIDLGNLIKVIDSYTGINTIYSVMKLNLGIEIGDHYTLDLTCNKWTPPPEFKDSFWIHQVEENNYATIDEDAPHFTERACQTFIMPKAGKLYEAYFQMRRFGGSGNFYVKLYEVDGDHKPIGSPIATSQATVVTGDRQVYTFYFDQNNRPQLNNGIEYAAVIHRWADFQIWYKSPHDYAGRMGIYFTATGWYMYFTRDLWFQLFFYEV